MARILIVEDEPNQRTVMTDLLARSGHEVRCAPDSQGAVQLAEEFKPDVLVADWLLRTWLTGRDVAEMLRKRNPDLRLVFISAVPVGVMASEAASLHPFKTVQKPCEFYDLLAVIHAVLQEAPVSEDGAP